MSEEYRYPNCPNCGAPRTGNDQFCANCGAALPPLPQSPVATTAIVPSAQPYIGSEPLLQFDIQYPESLSRWRIFVKWLLAFPHYIALWFLQMAVGLISWIGFFAILITGNFPRDLWDFILMVQQWQVRVAAYVLLQTDEYPPFGSGPYPANLHLEYPSSLSRWKIFVKWLLVIPNAFVFGFVSLAAMAVVLFSFFAILITGNMPKGAFGFLTGWHRWNLRLQAYTLLLTDKYPPFSLD